MAKEPIEGSAEFYRARAEEMLKQAEKATPDGKAKLIRLAQYWTRLAHSVEFPNW